MTPAEMEMAKLRSEQIKAAIPCIGPLLDAWEHLSNDARGTLKIEAPFLCDCLARLDAAWMGDD